jgi:Ca2+-transporting ATPase
MRTLRDVRDLPTAAEGGLTPEGVARSRQRFGRNVLTPLPREPLWKKFLEKFDEPIIKILLAAALLSMVVDLFKAGEHRPPAAASPAANEAQVTTPVPAPAVAPAADHIRQVAAGVALGVAGLAVAAAWLLGYGQWVPSILFLAALVLWPIGLLTGHASYDGLAVMVAVVLATGVAFASEYKSDREFELLNARKDAVQVKVLRGGTFHTVPLEDVVVGDAVLLEMGDEVPADGRLVQATDLYVDQSLMTGESEPARKFPRPADDTASGPEQPGCLYRGTQVVDGVGQLVVTDVGDDTYLGQIARRLTAADDEGGAETHGPATQERRVQHKLTISKQATPLQEKLEVLAGVISKVGYTAAGAIFVALLVRGLFATDPTTGLPEVYWPTGWDDVLNVGRNLLNYFMYMVIIIVVAVPEGLPMSVTVSLALAMQKMTRANALVRQLVACETIGSATVICSDKTGTLTQNRMQVVRSAWAGKVYDRGTPDWDLPAGYQVGNWTGIPLDWFVLNAAVNSTAHLEEKDGEVRPVGNSTEGALLLLLHEAGLEYRKLRLRYEPLYQVHFSSERKRMTTVIRQGDRLVALVKGAPEWLLEQSTHVLAGDGSAHEWTPETRRAVQEQLHDTARQAMRTLAFGYAVLPADTPGDSSRLHDRREAIEEGLVYAGFVGIRDPLREDVREAVARCRGAGVEVMMITGDNEQTARAVGREIGLLDQPGAVVTTSRQFGAWSDEELRERLPRLRILARARPLDKFRMVQALQEVGHVVAVTGDGTNDAPALKRADVGLAMGRAGTEVAKEASKIVLLDDAFSTIVRAVHWGRALYENIQRFLQFQLTINVSALAIAFLGPLLGVKPPFTILQLLWINVIMDTFASIALCSEPPRPGLLAVPPKRRDESILTRAMLWNVFTTAGFFVVVMLALLLGMEYGHWWAGPGPASEEFPELTVRQVSIFFTAYIFFQVWNEINCRSLVPDVSGLAGLTRNPVFLAILGATVVVQFLIVTFAGALFKVEPLGALDWLVIAGATASVLVFREAARRVQRLVQRPAAIVK